MISYAQNFEDVVLWRALKEVVGGFYVDVGAFDPDVDSVTKWFYDQGWSGINIEPGEQAFRRLAAQRPRDLNLQIAAASSAGNAVMRSYLESPGLSRLHADAVDKTGFAYRDTVVDTQPLRDILKAVGTRSIHFLKIDVEGAEREVLLGMDFTAFRPWIVVVEATLPQSQERSAAKWEDLMVTANYIPVYFDGLNQFYVASEKMELAPRLALPPNVFDEFEMAAAVSLRQQISALEVEGVARERFIASLQSEQSELRSQNSSLGTLLAEREALLAALRGDLATIAQAVAVHRQQYSDIVNSRSWRWLAPARRATTVLRRLLRR